MCTAPYDHGHEHIYVERYAWAGAVVVYQGITPLLQGLVLSLLQDKREDKGEGLLLSLLHYILCGCTCVPRKTEKAI